MSRTNINSISNFLKALSKVVNKDPECEYFFRGHANRKWKVLPAIYRNNPTNSYILNEDKIFREIISKAPHEFINENSAIEKLVKMQHYGIPTRLLDVTSNALVALYFACIEEEYNNSAGEIIVFEIPKKRIKFYDSDQVSMLANLAKISIDYKIEKEHLDYRTWLDSESFKHILSEQSKKLTRENFETAQIKNEIEKQNKESYWPLLTSGTTFTFDRSTAYYFQYDLASDFDKDAEIANQWYFYDFLRYFNSSDFAGYLLHEIKNEKPQFQNGMIPFHFDNIIPVKVKQSNARIIKQSGAFLLFGMKNGDKSTPPNINHLGFDEGMTIKISKIGVAAGSFKRNIIKELETLGITESTLFPEIEHQAAVIKKIYK